MERIPENRCSICHGSASIIRLACGHLFHPRCIFVYPIARCAVCGTVGSTVELIPPPDPPISVREYDRNNERWKITSFLHQKPRHVGKWTEEEDAFAALIIREYMHRCYPLRPGISLRGFLAALLFCPPMRLSKKYQLRQLCNGEKYTYKPPFRLTFHGHVRRQRKFTKLQNNYLAHLTSCPQHIHYLKCFEAKLWFNQFQEFSTQIQQHFVIARADVPTTIPVMPLAQQKVATVTAKPPPNYCNNSSISVGQNGFELPCNTRLPRLQDQLETVRQGISRRLKVRNDAHYAARERWYHNSTGISNNTIKEGMDTTSSSSIDEHVWNKSSGLSDLFTFFRTVNSSSSTSTDENFERNIQRIDTEITDTWTTFDGAYSDMFQLRSMDWLGLTTW